MDIICKFSLYIETKHEEYFLLGCNAVQQPVMVNRHGMTSHESHLYSRCLNDFKLRKINPCLRFTNVTHTGQKWWTEKPSETCRASYRKNNLRKVASRWLYSGNILAMHWTMIVKWIQVFDFFFDVLLTVHLIIFISVINQLDAQNFCFKISLFHASTCFEHMCSSSHL